MIYVDTSVALAALWSEDRVPAAETWQEPLVSSRLLHHELWTRLHARGIAASESARVTGLPARIGTLSLEPDVLARALEPFPEPVRTLDALHLASLLFLRERAPGVHLATFDARMARVARSLGVPVVA